MAITTDGVCVPAKCGKYGKSFYMIYYKSFDNYWVQAYGKKELPESGKSGFGGSKAVRLTPTRIGPQYKCPFCGDRYYFNCWNCGQRTCYDGDDHDGREVVCAHCGKTGWFQSNSKGEGGERKTKETMGIEVKGQV